MCTANFSTAKSRMLAMFALGVCVCSMMLLASNHSFFHPRRSSESLNRTHPDSSPRLPGDGAGLGWAELDPELLRDGVLNDDGDAGDDAKLPAILSKENANEMFLCCRRYRYLQPFKKRAL